MYREPMTVQEIATFYGISRERVCQILKDALEKLRNNPDCQCLREYLGGF
jgi:DNA-directed RNA polymerase sigma subunit (sigma70/sigma32)